MKKALKTPISYYGGKQLMLKHILPIIPAHKVYVEPFVGGGAVFWAKEPSECEIINDKNGSVVNFYKQLKLNFDQLKLLIDATPFSRENYKNAMVIYNCPYLFNELQRAWAFWVVTSQGFSKKIGSWMSSSIKQNLAPQIENKKLAFDECLKVRLNLTQIEHLDAIELIRRTDSPETFFYLDPPYVNSNQGHYSGYIQENFNELLDTISKIKGKFLLSSYPNTQLDNYRQKYGWYYNDMDMSKPASKNNKARKVEALTANYPII